MPKPPALPSDLVPATEPKPHQRIKELARLPRGKAWASRLCAFEDAIRAQRKAHKSYREIATWLDTQGLRVSASSVHGFVKARALRKRPLYSLPESTATPVAPAPTAAPASAIQSPPSIAAAPLVPASDEANHDLLGEPIDPDAENPFKMRKRQAQRTSPT